MTPHRFEVLSLAAASAVLGGCVDGVDPASLDGERAVPLQAAAVFADAPTATELGTLSRARVTALDAADGAVVGSALHELTRDMDEWALEVTVDIGAGRSVRALLEIELLSVDPNGAELVLWSGASPAVLVRADTELREIRLVSLFRGPLDNLAVTSVSLVAPEGISFGQSAAVSAEVSGGGSGAMPFFASLDPTVALVHPLTGAVETADTGSARLVATAGPQSDTVPFFVVAPPDPEDPEVVAMAASTLDDAGERIVQALGDAEGAAAIARGLQELSTALASGDAMSAIRAFREAVAAWLDYGADSEELRFLDGPQLSLIELSLIHVADALGVPFG